VDRSCSNQSLSSVCVVDAAAFTRRRSTTDVCVQDDDERKLEFVVGGDLWQSDDDANDAAVMRCVRVSDGSVRSLDEPSKTVTAAVRPSVPSPALKRCMSAVCGRPTPRQAGSERRHPAVGALPSLYPVSLPATATTSCQCHGIWIYAARKLLMQLAVISVRSHCAPDGAIYV